MSDNASLGSGSMGSRSAGSRSLSPSSRTRGSSPGKKIPSSKNKSPTGAINKAVASNALDADNLRRLELQIALQGDPTFHLDYPCKDRSKGVQDFSSWSFFRREQCHRPPVNMRNSFLWNDTLVERVNKQREYRQAPEEEEPKLTGYRETQQNLLRKKRAKKMLAIWKKTPTRSVAGATDGGALTARTDANDVLTGGGGGLGRGGSKLGDKHDRGRATSSRSTAGAGAGSARGDRSLSRSQSRGRR